MTTSEFEAAVTWAAKAAFCVATVSILQVTEVLIGYALINICMDTVIINWIDTVYLHTELKNKKLCVSQNLPEQYIPSPINPTLQTHL